MHRARHLPVPEDRKRAGLILEDDITSNISLPNLPVCRCYLLIAIARREWQGNKPGGSTSGRIGIKRGGNAVRRQPAKVVLPNG
jgi:ABC-type sugar transport system ATPase subunit